MPARQTNSERWHVYRRNKRRRALVDGFTKDLGGPDKVSTGQRLLIDHATTLTLEIKAMEKRGLSGEADSVLNYSRALGALSRVLRQLGMKREGTERLPDLADFKYAEDEA